MKNLEGEVDLEDLGFGYWFFMLGNYMFFFVEKLGEKFIYLLSVV